MLSEELIKKENWLHFSDDVLNLSVIKTTLGRWHGTFSKNATILLRVVNNDYHKVLHINHYIRLQDIVLSPSAPPSKNLQSLRTLAFPIFH